MFPKEAVEKSTIDLIAKLQSCDYLQGFVLAGGTALALQIEHRKSVDIDLFSKKDFNPEIMTLKLERDFNFNTDLIEENTLKGSINGIKTDILTHPYKDITEPLSQANMLIFKKEDIAAMKINAISVSGNRSKDFIDIYFLLDFFTIEQMIGFYLTKYSQRNSFHAVKSLIYFNDLSTKDWPVMIKQPSLKLSQVKKRIEQEVNKYFRSI
jgi:hypothetical protein